MKVLITGGAGFIGSHIVDRLVELNHDVVCVDNMSWGFEENLNPKVKLERIDIVNSLEYYKLHNLFKSFKPEMVIHCAASLEVMLGQSHPIQDLTTNTIGTINILDSMRLSDTKKLINFSSACVYGVGRLVDSLPTSEKSPIIPQWGYGSSKAAAEIYCNQYARTYKLNVIHIRPGIVCGPREWFGRALTVFVKRAVNGQDIVVFGNGKAKRDFVHVDDVVNVAMKSFAFLSRPHYTLEPMVFNAGSERRTSIVNLAQMVAKKLNVEVIHEEVLEGEASSLVEGRYRIPFEMESMWLSMFQSKLWFNHTPSKTIDQIIDDEIDWYKNNKERWDKEYKV